MKKEEIKPNIIVRGPIFPEPVQIIVGIPMGDSIKLIGKGLSLWISIIVGVQEVCDGI